MSWCADDGHDATQSPPDATDGHCAPDSRNESTQLLETQVYADYYLQHPPKQTYGSLDAPLDHDLDLDRDHDRNSDSPKFTSLPDNASQPLSDADDAFVTCDADADPVPSSNPTIEPLPTSPAARTPMFAGRKRDRAGMLLPVNLSTPGSADPVSLSKAFGAVAAPQLTQLFNTTQAGSSPGPSVDVCSSPGLELPTPYIGRGARALANFHGLSPSVRRSDGDTFGFAELGGMREVGGRPSSSLPAARTSTIKKPRRSPTDAPGADLAMNDSSPPASVLAFSPRGLTGANHRSPLEAFKTPGRSKNAPIFLSSNVKVIPHQETAPHETQSAALDSRQREADSRQSQHVTRAGEEQSSKSSDLIQDSVPSSPLEHGSLGRDGIRSRETVMETTAPASQAALPKRRVNLPQARQAVLAPNPNAQNVPSSLHDSLPQKTVFSISSGETRDYSGGHAIPETSPANRSVLESQRAAFLSQHESSRVQSSPSQELSRMQDAQPQADGTEEIPEADAEEDASDESPLSSPKSSVSLPTPSMSPFTQPSTSYTQCSQDDDQITAAPSRSQQKICSPPPRARRKNSFQSSVYDTPRRSKRITTLIVDDGVPRQNIHAQLCYANTALQPSWPSTEIDLPSRQLPKHGQFPFRVLAQRIPPTTEREFCPATIRRTVQRGANTMHVVCFDGFQPDELLAEPLLCPLDLREGDEVQVDRDGKRNNVYIVRAFKDRIEGHPRKYNASVRCDVNGYQTITLERRQAHAPVSTTTEAPEVLDVSVSEISIKLSQWPLIRDRMAASQSQLLSFREAAQYKPQSSKTGDVCELSSRAGIFTGMAFAVSISKDGHGLEQRRQVEAIVRKHGGKILTDGFRGLFADETARGLCKLPMEPRNLAGSMGFTALISDTHSRTSKYLQALALNVPCLSTRFVLDCDASTRLQPWMRYLLAAGASEALEGAVRSRTLYGPIDSDARRMGVAAMVSRRGQPLAGWQVVMMHGQGFLDEARALAFLAAAMGAESVDMVAGLAGAESQRETYEDVACLFVCAGRVELARARQRLLRSDEDEQWLVVDKNGLLESVVLGELPISVS